MILGTAGHIDHGKTTLVRALTGVDTDRLPEERKRGITIELGFAPLLLEGIGTIGVVDVPGHEAFVRTMVAGATGIDLALVVIAADEGVMPQTREHLAILELLGVRNGVVALTKADLVDEEWLALVEEEARAATCRALPDAVIVRTSATTGEGLDALREALRVVAGRIERRDERDLFRLPVDRAFSVKGTGTVVTGTVWSGRLGRDEIVRVLPGDRTARVRGIQSHGAQLDTAVPGTRSAVALTGVDVPDVPRGSTIVTDREWHATKLARAELTMVLGVEVEVRPRTWFRLHVGTSEVGARIVTTARGASTFSARLVLDEAVVLRGGDRVVLRTSAPLNTVAGGVITDAYAPRRAKLWPVGADARARLRLAVEESGGQGIDPATIPVRLGVPPRAVPALVDATPEVSSIGGRVVAADVVTGITDALRVEVANYQRAHRLDVGMPMQLVRSRLPGAPEVVAAVLQREINGGALTSTGGFVHENGWVPKLEADALAAAEFVRVRLDRAGSEPPSTEELGAEFGVDVSDVVRYLERTGELVQVEANRHYSAQQMKSLIDRLRAMMAGGAEATPAELRDGLGLSRKYLIPFLEYCDRAGYTNRSANGRVWKGT